MSLNVFHSLFGVGKRFLVFDTMWTHIAHQGHFSLQGPWSAAPVVWMITSKVAIDDQSINGVLTRIVDGFVSAHGVACSTC
jgi:hypothetical protein